MCWPSLLSHDKQKPFTVYQHFNGASLALFYKNTEEGNKLKIKGTLMVQHFNGASLALFYKNTEGNKMKDKRKLA